MYYQNTVSNFLNGRSKYMDSITEEFVLNAIEHLGYKPNQVKQQLRTGYMNDENVTF